VFSALGLYPTLPGVGGFVVGSPVFPAATVHLAGGKVLQVNAAAASDDAPFVQGRSVNQVSAESLWIAWSSIAGGGELDFDLGTSPGTWGAAPGNAPPSFSQ